MIEKIVVCPAFVPYSYVQNSEQAIEVGVYVVRAFVRLREMIVSNKELTMRLDELESKVDLKSVRHDAFARNTRLQFTGASSFAAPQWMATATSTRGHVS